MAMRAWTVWAVGIALASGLAAVAKPPELPGNPTVNGKVPAPLMQDHYQVEAPPPPRLLPPSVLDPKPKHGPETAEVNTAGVLVPHRSTEAAAADWMTMIAFARAESHFDACETAEARRWYQAVISRAPGSRYASLARERLFLGKVIPAGLNQTREPPLADPAGLPKRIPATANGPID